MRQLKTNHGNHVLIYQSNKTDLRLINVLKRINENFIIYGFDKERIDDNLTFRKFNETKLYNDLKDSKAVITNEGFSLISEAIYLKKPTYNIPING
ncbi:MAG: hypothetical protein LBV42_03505 [Methanobrevibacter sp.]|nr:hypothetical protein [Methanobrevibacter sp.]